MESNEVECLTDEDGVIYYVLINNGLDIYKKYENKKHKFIHVNKKYYKNKILHREDGPAIEWKNGTKVWYKEGLRHREDGPAIEYSDGSTEWYKNGVCHREDGPTIEYANGDKYWHKNGELHREGGPAIEYNNGNKEYYLNGENLSEIEYKKYLIEKEHKNLSESIKNNNINITKIKI